MNEPWLSIVIPVLNEAALIEAALQQLQALRAAGIELIVVDGGSDDGSQFLAAPLADQCLQASGGRAGQMNAGAVAARGRYLLFLHIDTALLLTAEQLRCFFSSGTINWGFFPVRLSGSHCLLRVIAWAMSRRSALTAIATGDQCLFVDRHLFDLVGRFPEIPLMEDVALCKQLRKQARPTIFPAYVTTSSRRWERRGIIKTVCLMWRLRLAYFLGAKPEALVKDYYG